MKLQILEHKENMVLLSQIIHMVSQHISIFKQDRMCKHYLYAMVLMEQSVLIAFTQQDIQESWLVLHMLHLDGITQPKNLMLLLMKPQILEHKHNTHLLSQTTNTVCQHFSTFKLDQM